MTQSHVVMLGRTCYQVHSGKETRTVQSPAPVTFLVYCPEAVPYCTVGVPGSLVVHCTRTELRGQQ